MAKIYFVSTLIPADKFKKKYELGGITIYHIGETLDEKSDAYKCWECTVPTTTFSEDLVKTEFEAFGKEMQAFALQIAKQLKIAEIDAYDKSSSVNGFYLNGMLIPWSKDDPSSPNVDKRMGLRQNIADKVALGEENISIWMKGMSFTMPCAQAEMLMRSIENYAYECFNVTAAHKKAVSELTTIEEVEKYDITAGYPAQLKMEV